MRAWGPFQAAVCLAAACLLLAGCGRPDAGPFPDDGRLRVTATTGMIADAARVVGGDRVAVQGLMGPGVDPHLYRASQRDLVRLTEADLILYNGIDLEGRMAQVLERLAATRPVVRVTDTIPVSDLRRVDDYGEAAYDPHVWFDAGLWMHVVERIRDAFIEHAPDGAETFAANAAAYLDELEALDAWTRDAIASIPEEARVLVTAHDAFGYFGAAYGIEVVALQGLSTAAEYGLRDVERVADLIVSRRVKAVFIETSLSPRAVEALVAGVRARGHEVAVGGELYSDALGAADSPTGTYAGMFRHNVETLVEALQ